MRLPSASAYMEALQDPSTCFADPQLRAGTAALGPLGLPRAVSGNVATVFRVDSPDGRGWAVRCFVRPVDDERLRYEAIGAHLAGLRSTWRVGFDLQPCGIRVDGEWWPVVKMAWAPGEPLLSYVQRHLWDGPALAYLAQRFADLAEGLGEDGVAHGDLQHGNILVAPGGDLRLVDYDGMYVPALAGRGGTERGHRNYQHPGRGRADFGPGLDHFSSWVIYASLAALSVDPLLWGRLDGGEEALLLRQHDLDDPGRSPALAAMEASDGPGVAALGGLLRSFLSRPPEEVPPLSARSVQAVSVPGGGDLDLAQRRSLYEALQNAPGTPSNGTRLPPVAQSAKSAQRRSWLRRRTPEARAAGHADALLEEPRRAVAAAAAAVDRLNRKRAQVAAAEDKALRRAERAQADLRAKEEVESRRVRQELEATLADVARRERDTHRCEQEACAAALATLQGQVLRTRLARHRVTAAASHGVSDAVLHRLAAGGVRSAADLTDVDTQRSGAVVVRPDGRQLKVSGLDASGAAALMTWRRQVEGAVRLDLPTSLPPDTVAAVRAEHAARRAGLAGEAESARARARRRAAEIRARWQAQHDAVVAQQKAAESAAAQQRVELDRELARAGKDLAEAQWRLDQHVPTSSSPLR